MKTLGVFCALFITLWSGTTSAVPGVVVEIKGTVTATPNGGGAVPAKVGLEFEDGTAFQVGEKSAAKLMLMDGALQELAANAKWIAGADPVKAKMTNPGLLVAMREAVTQTGSGPTVHGMVKMTPGVPLYGELKLEPPVGGISGLYPTHVTIRMPKQVVFQWEGEPVAGAEPVLVFFPADGEKQIFKISGDQKELKLDAKKLKLQAGKEYGWFLGHLEGGSPISQSRKFIFQILNAAKEKELAKELGELKKWVSTDEALKFLQAQVYFKYKMYDQMLVNLEPLYEEGSVSAVKRLLFVANVRLGRLEKAKELQ